MDTTLPFLILISAILIGGFVLEIITETLNLKNLKADVPKEFPIFTELLDGARYARSIDYLKENTRLRLMESAVSVSLWLFLFGTGLLFSLDEKVGHVGAIGFLPGEITRSILFALSLVILSWLVHLPFSLKRTFGIEAKYGFNRMTAKTFIGDLLKGTLLGAVLGVPVLGFLSWFFLSVQNAWLVSWIFVVGFELFVIFIAPMWIMPLFNRFEAVPAGPLRERIEEYARSQKFTLQGIFTMDGSKRSSKANAFFTGFGRSKRIVLFDTLVQKLSLEELMAVLAHEVGHFKKKHIFLQLGISTAWVGLLLWLFDSFRLSGGYTLEVSAVLFVTLFQPISSIYHWFTLWLSRRNEFEADDFSAETFKKPKALAEALAKLSIDSMSNLHPHPFKVFQEYTHPPVLQRMRRLM